jgi:hypothetical protein
MAAIERTLKYDESIEVGRTLAPIWTAKTAQMVNTERLPLTQRVTAFRVYLALIVFIAVSDLLTIVVRFDAFKFNLSAANFALLLLLPGTLILFKSRALNQHRRWYSHLMVLGGLVVAGNLIAVFKPGGALAASFMITGGVGLTTLWVTLMVVHTRERFISVVQVLAIAAAGISLLTIFGASEMAWSQYVPRMSEGVPALRIGDFEMPFQSQSAFGLTGADSYGTFIGIAIAVVLANFLSRSRPLFRSSVLSVLLLSVYLFSIVILQSRGTYVSVALIVLLIGVIQVTAAMPSRLKQALRVALVTVGVLAGIWATNAIIDQGVDREWGANYHNRVVMAQSTIDAFQKSPFLGGSKVDLNEAASGTAHSSYLEILLTQGPGPLVILVVFLIYVVRPLPHNSAGSNPLRMALMIALLAALVQNLFYVGVYEKIFWLIAALVVVSGAVVPASQRKDISGVSIVNKVPRQNRPGLQRHTPRLAPTSDSD